jgi:membrane protease YdiL (CAAX protease family)
VSLFVFSLLSFLLAVPLFGLSFQQVFQGLGEGSMADNILLFKFLQSFQTIGLFVVPPFLFSWLYSHSPWQYLKAHFKLDIGSVIFVIILIFVAVPFIGYLGKLNQSLDLPDTLKSIEDWLIKREDTARELTQKFLTAKGTNELILNIFMIGVLPAIGEEFVFRGVLQKVLHKWTKNIHWAVIISAFAFSAMHVQFYGLLPRFMLGLLFGYFLVWTGSIWLPVIGHFLNNTTAVVYYYFLQRNENISMQNLNEFELSTPVIILSAAGIVFFCYLIYANEKKLRHE